jgi:hypothetical protein
MPSIITYPGENCDCGEKRKPIFFCHSFPSLFSVGGEARVNARHSTAAFIARMIVLPGNVLKKRDRLLHTRPTDGMARQISPRDFRAAATVRTLRFNRIYA